MLINLIVSVKLTLRFFRSRLTLLFGSFIIFTYMVSFNIGDKIIYPNQGLGFIEDIKKQVILGEELRIYYVRLLSNNTLVLIPSLSADEMGIRKPISEEAIDEIFGFMKEGMIDVQMNWKGRYKEHIGLMKNGTMRNVAFVMKSLYYLNLIKPLSFREKKMMEKAKELIVTEIASVASLSLETIEEKLLSTLSDCFKNIRRANS